MPPTRNKKAYMEPMKVKAKMIVLKGFLWNLTLVCV